jgi:hypothetical protein
MSAKRVRRRFVYAALLAVAAAAVAVVPAAGVLKERPQLSDKLARHLSSGVVQHFWATNPGAAPAAIKGRLSQAAAKAKAKANATTFCTSTGGNDVFNCDVFGLPQNEESISACTANKNYVLGGTNDYRGLIDPDLNFTGWHWSIDGGKSINNEGLLPPVALISDSGTEVPSGGDPVDFLFADGTGCHAFAASLAYDPLDPLANPNGIAVYRTEPSTLSTCPGGADPSCWPTGRLVAESDADHFLDKEWMFVGTQGGTAYVWITYSDFDMAPSDVSHEFEASIKAVRCTIDLVTCTSPIAISTIDDDVQFSDVTIGPDGKAYITWSRIDGELEGTDQTFTHKIRVETAAGSTTFGSENEIYAEDQPIPFGGFLQANDFRVATYPKSDIASVAGEPRVFVVWDACEALLLGTICEFAEIKLSYSDDGGTTWNGPYVISNGGVNYFPSISVDRANAASTKASVAWFTNGFNPAFWNAQDVVLRSIDTGASTYGPGKTSRLTKPSNETEADPLLGGFFIGDYIEVAQVSGNAFTHYNANYRQIELLLDGLPVNQQDNYLTVKKVK